MSPWYVSRNWVIFGIFDGVDGLTDDYQVCKICNSGDQKIQKRMHIEHGWH